MRALVLALAVLGARAQVPPLVWMERFEERPVRWQIHGETNLFVWDSMAGALDVTWDSSKTNSYFYRPLGLTLTRQDDFRMAFTIVLERIAIGTTEGKPHTFQIAAGLVNLTNAFDPEFFRGAGIDPKHGARNLAEFNYFPDSGFGATVAPTIATHSNNMAFSGNYPLEMQPGQVYRIEMRFNAATQTLTSLLWRNGVLDPPEGLKPLKLSASFADFGLNALAVASYSEAGQTPQFAGSIQARGWIDDVELEVWHRVPLRIAKEGAGVRIEFPTEAGWRYQLESSDDWLNWRSEGDEIEGRGTIARMDPASPDGAEFFRVRARRNAPGSETQKSGG